MTFPCRPAETSINVVVTDADAMAARLLAADLRRHRQFQVTECAPELSSILDCVADTSADILLVSTNLRDGALAGLVLLKRMRSQHPATRAIVLLESLERQLVAELFGAGAKGIFDRTGYDPRRLYRCIRSVAAGQVWANSEQIGFVLDVFAETASLHVVTAKGEGLLTKREQDVVRLVAQGLGNREVAEQLGLSEHTVKNYLFNVFDKLGISSRTELVMYALANSDNKLQRADEWEQPEVAV